MNGGPRRRLVLVVGQDRQETPLRYLVRGMRAEGWEVAVLNPDEFLIRGRSRLARILSRLTERVSWSAVAQAIVDQAAALQPDLVLAIKSLPIDAAQRRQLRARGARLALWYPDVSFDHGAAASARLLDGIDLFATSKHYHLPWMATRFPAIPTAFVEHGYCDDVHHPPVPPPERDLDVAYVGNHSPAKHAAIAALADARPALRIGVSGNGWTPDPRWQTFPPLVGEAMGRFLARARIALAVHYGPHGAQGWEDTTSARTFEIPACGVFMLHPDNHEVRRYYEPEREIGVFDDTAHMVREVDRWLADDDGRERCVARALVRTRPAYSYSLRGRQLAQWLATQGLEAA